MNNEIVLFETKDSSITLPVQMANDTVLLTANRWRFFLWARKQYANMLIMFFGWRTERNNNTQKMRVVGVKQPVPFYTLDVIISVGYRVKSQRGVEFRRWANSVLKQYILEGYAVNQKRISDLGKVVRLLKRTEHSLDAHQVLAIVEKYSEALTLLDSYDHQNMLRPKGNAATYILTYEECRNVIESLRFGSESSLFGNEKDDSFKGSIGNIYQSFDGKDLYPSLEEKAANLLYFVTKNHSFTDGNKRIAATMFLYFLDRNGILFADEEKLIDDLTRLLL